MVRRRGRGSGHCVAADAAVAGGGGLLWLRNFDRAGTEIVTTATVTFHQANRQYLSLVNTELKHNYGTKAPVVDSRPFVSKRNENEMKRKQKRNETKRKRNKNEDESKTALKRNI